MRAVERPEAKAPADSPATPAPRYHSPLRDERAADTRRRIAAAAMDLFVEDGFTGTTIARVAERAGVSTPTVYATFGSKGAIMAALLIQMEDDVDVAGWVERIATESDPSRKLKLFAEWMCALFSSSKAVIMAAQGAVTDPAIVELRSEGDRRRREGLRGLLSTLADAMRPDITQSEALDRAWMLTGLGLYLDATEGSGWSDHQYEHWLAGLLQSQLLDPRRLG